MTDSSYIIGSGPSLLNLSDEEKAYLNAHPRTLSLNQYLIHWKLIGVVPKCHMMADAQFPAMKLFFETMQAISELDVPVKYFYHCNYMQYFPRGLNIERWRVALRKRLQLWKAHSYAMPWRVDVEGHQQFSQQTYNPHPKTVDQAWTWARSIAEPLFFWRGTLTSAINLAAIIWPGKNVKLLGVDLNSYGYFFDPDLGKEKRDDLHEFNARRLNAQSATHHRKSHAMNVHATAVNYETADNDSLPGIQAAFPRMQHELAKDGRAILCANPDSLLVQENYCEYAPVIEC